MFRIIAVYGLIAGAIVAAAMVASMAIGAHSMVVGYLSMLVALSMVFVGIKKYRDDQLGGVIGFWPAAGVGLGISAVASLCYAVGWEVYLYSTDYSFMADYANSVVAAAKADGASSAEIAKMQADMAGFAKSYENPVYRFLITLSEIAPVAILVTLLSAALLRNRRFLPARTVG